MILVGDEAAPGNVEISAPGGAAVGPESAIVGTYRVRGFSLANAGNSGSDFALQSVGAGCALYFRNVEFGAAGGAHVKAERLGLAEADGDYAILAGADRHWWAANEGVVSVVGRNISMSGTLGFSGSFAYANVAGLITCAANNFSGSATGRRFDVRENGTIRSNGATLPGSMSGTSESGGVYV